MLAINEINQLPGEIVELLGEANPDVFRPCYHALDFDGRFIDVIEQYAGCARIATLCGQTGGCLHDVAVFNLFGHFSNVLD